MYRTRFKAPQAAPKYGFLCGKIVSERMGQGRRSNLARIAEEGGSVSPRRSPRRLSGSQCRVTPSATRTTTASQAQPARICTADTSYMPRFCWPRTTRPCCHTLLEPSAPQCAAAPALPLRRLESVGRQRRMRLCEAGARC